MSMWEMVIYLVVNFMAINITVRFAECFLKNNIRSRRGRIGGIVIYWLINSLVYLIFRNDTYNLLTSLGGIIFIAIIVYNGSILKRIMAAILAFSMGMVSETIIWYIFTPADPGSQSKLMMNIVSVLMYFGLQLLVDHFCHLKKGDLASEKYYLLIMVFPFLSIWFVYLLFADKVNNSLVLFGILFIILILNFFLFYTIFSLPFLENIFYTFYNYFL